MLGIEGIPDPGSFDPLEDGLIFPIPGVSTNSIVMEPRDGHSVSQLDARSVELKRNGKLAIRCRDVRIVVFITDARLAIACSKYDKGGGWIGGATAMIVLNSVSKARAAIRSRGKMLVGQARYPWITRVGSTSKSGFGSEERLVVEAQGADGTAYQLTLGLPKNLDAALIASKVANRAAAFRLACGPRPDEAAGERLRVLTTVGPLPPASAKNHIAFHVLPGARRIEPTSARFTPGDAGVAGGGSIPPPPPPPPPVDLAALTGGDPGPIAIPEVGREATGGSAPDAPGRPAAPTTHLKGSLVSRPERGSPGD